MISIHLQSCAPKIQKNSCIFVKFIVKKNQWHLFYVDTVCDATGFIRAVWSTVKADPTTLVLNNTFETRTAYYLVTIDWNIHEEKHINPLQSNEPLYGNTVIGTVAVDGWAVTWYSGEGPGRAAAPTVPSSLYQM